MIIDTVNPLSNEERKYDSPHFFASVATGSRQSKNSDQKTNPFLIMALQMQINCTTFFLIELFQFREQCFLYKDPCKTWPDNPYDMLFDVQNCLVYQKKIPPIPPPPPPPSPKPSSFTWQGWTIAISTVASLVAIATLILLWWPGMRPRARIYFVRMASGFRRGEQEVEREVNTCAYFLDRSKLDFPKSVPITNGDNNKNNKRTTITYLVT